jgi:hypothetical protein
MTKKHFEPGDKIGPYVLDEFAGTNTKGEPRWYAKDENGTLLKNTVSETALRKILRTAEFTPQDIRNLSSRAYNELVEEIGEDGIREILGATVKQTAPEATKQREIAAKWFAWHPQVPQTRANTKRFDDYLERMPNPTFTSRDFDKAFADEFLKLELNPEAAGIKGFGQGIRGWEAIDKLTSSQVQQLQKSFAAARTIDFSKLSPEGYLTEVGLLTDSADEFIEKTREIDKVRGIKQPVPPLLAQAREQIWSNFFQIHPDLSPTEGLQVKLEEILKANDWPILNQHLDAALDQLIQSGDPVIERQSSSVYKYGGTRAVLNQPRPTTPQLISDGSPVAVTLTEINAMDGETYGKKCLDPEFSKAVERLYKTV